MLETRLRSFGGSGGGVSIGGAVTSGTSGSVLFVDSSGNLGQDNTNFFWDDTNNRLGIGLATPAYPVDAYLASAGAFMRARSGTTAASGFLSSNSSRVWGTQVSAAGLYEIYDYSGTASRLTIDSSGIVVAGTLRLGGAASSVPLQTRAAANSNSLIIESTTIGYCNVGFATAPNRLRFANTSATIGMSWELAGASGSFVFAGGTVTSSSPWTHTQTWNSSGVTFNAFLVNVTNTASAAGSLLADLQIGGTSKFKVDKDGVGTFVGDVSVADEAYGSGWNGSVEVPTKNAVYDKIQTNAVESHVVTIDGGGSVIATGEKTVITIPYDCTIESVTMLADQSGSIVIDIWKDTYTNYAPTVADTITASAKPTITTATKSQDSTLTGWTTTVTAGDILKFNVDSVTTITRVVLSLKVRRT